MHADTNRTIRMRLICCTFVPAMFTSCSAERMATSQQGNTANFSGDLAWAPDHPDAPVLLFHRYPAYSRKPVWGPIVGVWADGHIVRIKSEDAIGQQYIGGMLSDAQQDDLLRFISSHPGLLDPDGGHVIVDAASEQLMFRLKGRRVTYGETVGHHNQFTPNKDMAALRSYLMAIEIAEAKPCDAPWKVPPSNLFD